jgi:hypothetical protein
VGEAVLEHAAAQVRLELLDDEVGQAAGLVGALEEARPVLLDELVQQRLVGPATLVAVSARSRRARRASSHDQLPAVVGSLCRAHA